MLWPFICVHNKYRIKIEEGRAEWMRWRTREKKDKWKKRRKNPQLFVDVNGREWFHEVESAARGRGPKHKRTINKDSSSRMREAKKANERHHFRSCGGAACRTHVPVSASRGWSIFIALLEPWCGEMCPRYMLYLTFGPVNTSISEVGDRNAGRIGCHYLDQSANR